MGLIDDALDAPLVGFAILFCGTLVFLYGLILVCLCPLFLFGAAYRVLTRATQGEGAQG